MRSPPRSLAYAWAKHTLESKVPTWFPWLLTAMALLAGITALFFRGMNGGFVVATFSFAVLAVQEWGKQGFREVFEEQQQRLRHDAHTKKDA